MDRILHFEAMAFLYGLAATVACQMLTGSINSSGLLSEKSNYKRKPHDTSAARVQLLVATLAAAGSYIGQVAHSSGVTLPDISNQWLYLMGGSSSIYALGKTWNLMRKQQD